MEDVTLPINSLSSEMVHSDMVISANKRKRGKSSNALPNVDLISSEMVHSDVVISPKQGFKKKKNRKMGKNTDALANVELIQQPIDVTGLVTDSRLEQRDVQIEDCDDIRKSSFGHSSLSKDSNISGRDSSTIVDTKITLEVNGNQVPEGVNPVSIFVEHNGQACANIGSKELSLDAPLAKKKRKSKRTNGRKNLDIPSSNDVQFNGLNAPSVNISSVENESIRLATTNTGLVVNSEVMLHGAELGLPVEILKHQSTCCSSGEIRCIEGRPVAADLKSTQEADTNSFSKAVESENGDLACSVNVSEKLVTVPLQTQKTKRKKKKKNLNALVRSVIVPSTSVIGASELMQHSAEQGAPQGIHLNECPTKGKNCIGEDSSCIFDMKVDETSVSQGKTVGNMQGGKKRKRKTRGKNLNLEPKKGVISLNGLSEEQQVKTAKVDTDQNAGVGRMLTGCAHKKLLVLDLNGLLADVVGDKTIAIQADGNVAGKKIFKRPFCEDFLQFCFEKFTVGVWSSRKKQNVNKVLKVLMRERERSKLAFKWNQSHCTKTGLKTIENSAKPLFLKELSKLWEWENKNKNFSLKVGDYDKSNTLLLDDSPYKALKNPPYTAIFPTPYQYQDQNDNALGPGGDLRVYLEGLALAEDVQKYVEQNPFGQKSITDSDPSWSFYSKVLCSRSGKQTSKRNRKKSIIRKKRNRNKSNQSSKNRVGPASKSVPV